MSVNVKWSRAVNVIKQALFVIERWQSLRFGSPGGAFEQGCEGCVLGIRLRGPDRDASAGSRRADKSLRGRDTKSFSTTQPTSIMGMTARTAKTTYFNAPSNSASYAKQVQRRCEISTTLGSTPVRVQTRGCIHSHVLL